MAKTANVYARIEPELKEKAEKILNGLGLSASSAIDIFYTQIVLNNGIPFAIKYPNKIQDINEISQQELETKLNRAREDKKQGRTYDAENVFAQLREEFGLNEI